MLRDVFGDCKNWLDYAWVITQIIILTTAFACIAIILPVAACLTGK